MKKNQKHFIIALIAGVILYFVLPESHGLTNAGVRMLSVFLPTIYLWLTCGTGWTSLFSVTVAVMLQVAPGVPSYMTLWGNICGAAVIPFLMVASVMEESGAFEWIVKWIISRKFIHGRPTLFMIMFTVAMVIISIFTAPQVVAVLFFRLLYEVTQSIGYTKEDDFYKAHGLLVGWVSQTCDGILIWGRPYVLTMVALVAGLGFSKFTAMTYFKVAVIYLVIMIVGAMIVIKLFIRPDVSKFEHFDDAKMRADLKANPITKKGKIAIAGMLVILTCYVLAYCSFLGPVAEYFSGISIAASVTLVCALLCIITVDGEPVMDLNKAAAKVPWSMIIFLGAIMFYAGNVGAEEYGISACLQSLLGPVVSNMPVMLAMFLGVLIASVITNFCSNTVAGVVVCSSFVPAMMSVPGISPAQVLAFACAVIAICGTAICTVSACPTMGIVYSDIGIEYKGTAKYSIVVCAIMIIVSCLIIIPLGSSLLAGVV
ncbi:MAG: anion permease [Lachnospiraceae bacterium]|nr:anion permease [Lachnospiraceae bacterium]